MAQSTAGDETVSCGGYNILPTNLKHGPFQGEVVAELLCAGLCHQPLHEERRLVAAREQSPLHGCLLAAVVPGLHVPAWGGTVVGTGQNLEGSGPIRHSSDICTGTDAYVSKRTMATGAFCLLNYCLLFNVAIYRDFRYVSLR